MSELYTGRREQRGLLPADSTPAEALDLLTQVGGNLAIFDQIAIRAFHEQVKALKGWRFLEKVASGLIGAVKILETPDGGAVRLIFCYKIDILEDDLKEKFRDGLPLGDEETGRLISQIIEQGQMALVEYYEPSVIAVARQKGKPIDYAMNGTDGFHYCQVNFDQTGAKEQLPASVIRKAQLTYFEQQIERFVHFERLKKWHDKAEEYVGIGGKELEAVAYLNDALLLFMGALGKIERREVGGINQVIEPEELEEILKKIDFDRYWEYARSVKEEISSFIASDKAYEESLLYRLKSYAPKQIADMVFEKNVLDIFAGIPSEQIYDYMESVETSIVSTEQVNSYRELLGNLKHAYMYKQQIGIAGHFRRVGKEINPTIVKAVKRAIRESDNHSVDMPYIDAIDRFATECSVHHTRRHNKIAKILHDYIQKDMKQGYPATTDIPEQELNDYLRYVKSETRRKYLNGLVGSLSPAVLLAFELSLDLRFEYQNGKTRPRDCSNVWNAEVVAILNKYFDVKSYKNGSTEGAVPYIIWESANMQALLNKVAQALEQSPALPS